MLNNNNIKIATWNVNSVRVRLDSISKWLDNNSFDIILFQEIKCEDDKFPKEFFDNYNIKTLGQKTYNGVAILSKGPIEIVNYDELNSNGARYIEGITTINSKTIRVASVYVPNGASLDSQKMEEKLQFFKNLKNRMSELLKLEEVIIIGGDFNVAPSYIDTYIDDGRLLCSQKERLAFNSLLSTGFYDAFRCLHKDTIEYSWFDYRMSKFSKNEGMRIDHFLISPKAVDILESCKINQTPRGFDKTSDHCPVELSIRF